MTASSPVPALMHAAVFRAPAQLAVEERPVPAVGPRDALIRVSHCGVCGTDLHMVLDGWARPNSIGGHEYSGRIAALGAEVTGGWALGDLVVGGPRASCGVCEYCLAGRAALCAERAGIGGESEFQGAFAEYVRVHESQLYRIPPGVALREAALTEPLAVALHALTLSGIRPGQRALVTGAGPLGLLTVAALRARGVSDIVVSEPHGLRRERAGRVGATVLRLPDELEDALPPFSVSDQAVDAAFECSGNPRAMEAALRQLKRAGTLVLVGTGLQKPRFDHNRILLNELIVTGAFTYDSDGFVQALELLASGTLPTDLLVEPEEAALAELVPVMKQLAAGEIVGKVMIVPERA